MPNQPARDWTVLIGRLFLLIAAIMTVLAAWTLVSRVHMVRNWPVAEGVITQAELTQEYSTQGNTLCGSQFRVRYNANGKIYETEHRSTSRSNDCATWEREVAQMQGSKVAVLYDPEHPEKSYPGGGRNFGFFLAPVITGALALAFFVAGGLVIFFTRKMQPTEVSAASA